MAATRAAAPGQHRHGAGRGLPPCSLDGISSRSVVWVLGFRNRVVSRCAMDSSVCREHFYATQRQMHEPYGLRCHRHARVNFVVISACPSRGSR